MTATDPYTVRCFQHCDRTQNILCFSIPLICPLCGRSTTETESRIPPYVLPSPFVQAQKHPFAIIIKPTLGTFLQNYTDASNLHIGLTDSQGVTFDYDEEGVNINAPGWDQCVSIEMIQTSGDFSSEWDLTLRRLSKSDLWTKYRYHEDEYNCFDFVIQFLWKVRLHHVNPALRSKSALCQELVVQQTRRAGQYISIYRHIHSHGYLCQMVK
ncbi:MKRN2 opposite strand protein-like [Ylistrum balloti]|uniref:MKRN2 opposite strand protein-like n=1 Tax=Ylistrum balloti TaxID=509963 RepID=UPI002905E70F|nr:MKRN2 opposite strand protein-like [Ylistrum balloti]